MKNYRHYLILLLILLFMTSCKKQSCPIGKEAKNYLHAMGIDGIKVLDFDAEATNRYEWSSQELSDYVGYWDTVNDFDFKYLLVHLIDSSSFTISKKSEKWLTEYSEQHFEEWKKSREGFPKGIPQAGPAPTVDLIYTRKERELKAIAAIGAYAYQKGISVEEGDLERYGELLALYDTQNDEQKVFRCLELKIIDYIIHNQ